jgi:outer membrane lipoprotein SlyB
VVGSFYGAAHGAFYGAIHGESKEGAIIGTIVGSVVGFAVGSYTPIERQNDEVGRCLTGKGYSLKTGAT